MKALQLARKLVSPVKFVVLPGGKLPERKHDGDAGVSCYTRAIIIARPDPKNPNMRETWWDFTLKGQPYHKALHDGESRFGTDSKGHHYRLLPGESVSIGLGFNVEIPLGLGGFLEPRGSVIVKKGQRIHLRVLNTNPVDSGFTGEPWAEIRNDGREVFNIYHYSALVQLVIKPVWIGKIQQVKRIKAGTRGNGSNGSTGD